MQFFDVCFFTSPYYWHAKPHREASLEIYTPSLPSEIGNNKTTFTNFGYNSITYFLIVFL
jgi:hypothetical protein